MTVPLLPSGVSRTVAHPFSSVITLVVLNVPLLVLSSMTTPWRRKMLPFLSLSWMVMTTGVRLLMETLSGVAFKSILIPLGTTVTGRSITLSVVSISSGTGVIDARIIYRPVAVGLHLVVRVLDAPDASVRTVVDHVKTCVVSLKTVTVTTTLDSE